MCHQELKQERSNYLVLGESVRFFLQHLASVINNNRLSLNHKDKVKLSFAY